MSWGQALGREGKRGGGAQGISGGSKTKTATRLSRNPNDMAHSSVVRDSRVCLYSYKTAYQKDNMEGE